VIVPTALGRFRAPQYWRYAIKGKIMTSKSILLSLLVFISPITYSASFDCKKASTVTEKMICSDKYLGYTDEDLGDVYKSLMATYSSSEKSKIVIEQKKWIKSRNSICVNVQECKKIYKARISTLRKKLDEGVLLDTFTIDRKSCRATKNQETSIKCVSMKVYDPCDDSGGKWGAAQCGWIHTEIANRKINNIEKKIIETIKLSKSHTDALSNFNSSIEAWSTYLVKHCNFTNTVDDLDNFSSMHLYLAFCQRRVSEQRVEELEMVLSRSYSLQ
jgi:uncharacterized protein